MRGDYGPIAVGVESTVQDFTMPHETTIDGGVTIRHNVVGDHVTIGDTTLVAISSTIIPSAMGSNDCTITVESLFRVGQEVPECRPAHGAPARVLPLSEQQYEEIQ